MVAEEISETAALRLAYHYGGTEIYVPDPPRLVAGHLLVDTLGADLALALYRLFGRGRLAVPLGPLRQSSSRPVALPDELLRARVSEAARRIGVSVRTIYRARRRQRERQAGAQ